MCDVGQRGCGVARGGGPVRILAVLAGHLGGSSLSNSDEEKRKGSTLILLHVVQGHTNVFCRPLKLVSDWSEL